MKDCANCGKIAPISRFHKDKSKRDGHFDSCKKCVNARNRSLNRDLTEKQKKRRRYYDRNRYKLISKSKEYRDKNAARVRLWGLRKYGLTPESFEALFKRQNGGCGICGEVNLDGVRLHVDHDHATGKIRGLLCVGCNHMIGLAKDKIEILHRAADYLEAPRRVCGGFL